jgi:hypothetical protein
MCYNELKNFKVKLYVVTKPGKCEVLRFYMGKQPKVTLGKKWGNDMERLIALYLCDFAKFYFDGVEEEDYDMRERKVELLLYPCSPSGDIKEKVEVNEKGPVIVTQPSTVRIAEKEIKRDTTPFFSEAVIEKNRQEMKVLELKREQDKKEKLLLEKQRELEFRRELESIKLKQVQEAEEKEMKRKKKAANIEKAKPVVLTKGQIKRKMELTIKKWNQQLKLERKNGQVSEKIVYKSKLKTIDEFPYINEYKNITAKNKITLNNLAILIGKETNPLKLEALKEYESYVNAIINKNKNKN